MTTCGVNYTHVPPNLASLDFSQRQAREAWARFDAIGHWPVTPYWTGAPAVGRTNRRQRLAVK